MNILGHSLIALNTKGTEVGSGKHRYARRTRIDADNTDAYECDLIIGALLPESCPFIADNPFSFGEIHEGGEILLKFLKEKYPERIGLALGMLSHSVKYGADSFNKEVEKYAQNWREKGDKGNRGDSLLVKMKEAFNISVEDVPKRVHNILWAGVDFWILEKYPDLVKKIKKAVEIVDVRDIAGILAECFEKDEKQARVVVDELFKHIYQPEDLISKEGMIRIGIRHAAGLPEKDKVDFEKALVLVNECQEIMGDSWEGLLEEVEKNVRSRLAQIGY